MVSQMISGLGSWSPWSVGEVRCEECSSESMSKITRVGKSSLQQLSQSSTQSFANRRFSPLRLLMWASLFVNAHGQLTDPFPATMELSSLNGTNGFILNGENSYDESGRSVSSAGDLNGDGIDDFVIGAPYANVANRTNAGKSYVVYGSRNLISGGTLDLSSLDGTNGFIINGESAKDNAGVSVSSAGDVNGDGLSDLVIGANDAAPSGKLKAGKSYVVFGSRNTISGGILNLSSLNGTNGFILIGEAVDDRSGYSVSSAGDVNGDGIDDFVIGAIWATPSGRSKAGKSYVVFGSRNIVSNGTLELSIINGSNGFIINGDAEGDRSGWSVSSAGDVNGDGLSDLVIGAIWANPSSRSNAGKSYVVFGSRTIASGGTLELSGLDGTDGFILNGDAAYDETGYSVSSARDVNGDGLSDIVIGAKFADPLGRNKAGKSYVVFGSRDVVSGGTLDLASLNGQKGFILYGEAEDDRIGTSVSSAGDVNGDGIADIVIGAIWASPSRRSKAGKSYVLFGSPSIGSSGTLELASLNGEKGFNLIGEAPDDRSGWSVSSAGDVNGDGLPDLVIGAIWANPLGRTHAGLSYVVFGRNVTNIPQTSPTFFETTSPMIDNTSLPSAISPSLNTIAMSTKYTSTSMTSDLSQIASGDITPTIIGIAAGGTALCCSFFGGLCFFIMRRSKKSHNEPEQGMVGQNANLSENQYHQPRSSGVENRYNDWPQHSPPHSTDQYDQVELGKLNHDMEEYSSAIMERIHRNNDDRPAY